MSDENVSWETEITHDGDWPTRWRWRVTRRPDYESRSGYAFTKERAQRKAIRARLSMEREDVKIVERETA